jgi:hypothetical protein
MLRSDNGPEFEMSEFFSAHGTIRQLSCVETPQQNAIVECNTNIYSMLLDP